MVLKAGTVDDIELLMAFGADVQLQNYYGASVIHYAAMNDDPALCRYLLTNFKLNVNERCTHGITPLHFAAAYGKAAVVKELIERGARVDIKNLDGKSPLYFAVVNRRLEVIRVLLEEGADVNTGEQESDMILRAAIERGSRCTASMIVMYLAIQEAKGMPINPRNVKIIEERSYLQEYLEKCRAELRGTKEKKVYNKLSLFNILAGDKNAISGYARNKELVKNFEDSQYAVDYAIYGHILRSKMHWGVNRDEFERYVSRMLCTLLPLSDPEHLIVQMVTKCLYENDLPDWRKYDAKGEFLIS